MRNCPLCGSNKRKDYPYQTYMTCVRCNHTYQPDPPSKLYLNPYEEFNGGENSVMGEREKAINNSLANWLFSRIRPHRVLDIGSAYPYFAYCFEKIGCDVAALDGIYGNYKCNLDVPMFRVNWEDKNDGLYDAFAENDLITMIHVIEHFEDPIWCLKRAYDSLVNGGYLYLRCPNKDVKGIERDHTEGHTLIHPNIFGYQSLRYAAEKAGFTLVWSEDMYNAGQSSHLFKKGQITISAFMIVKNEEENITNCLQTVKMHANEIIVLDTGSTDKTKELAAAEGAKVIESDFFNSDTTMEEFHFSKARNESIKHATGDWIFWMDADDMLIAEKLNFSDRFDAYYSKIQYGGTSYNQVRFFRNNWGVYFKGAVHEYPVIDGCRLGTMPNCVVYHKSGDKIGRTDRNLTILQKEYERDPNNKRTLFYLANASREAGEYHKAIRYYTEYINSGGNFHDEVVLAKYYKGLSFYCLKQYDNTLSALHETMAFDDKWGEPYSLAGECYYLKGEYKKAISYLTIATEMSIPHTTMFVEKNRYWSIPRLWLSYCYEKLGDFQKAKEFVEGNLKREYELDARSYVIEVRRPGALGDVLCTTPAVRELRKKYPDAHIRYVTHKSAFPILQSNPHIDEVVTDSTGMHSDIKIEFTYPMHEGYPDIPMNRHLTQYFAECAGVKLSSNKPVLKLLPNDTIKLDSKKSIITFAVRTGWSRYKEWPLERWEELIHIFQDYQFIQLGASGEPKIKNAQYMCGKLTLRESLSVLAQSELFIGLDSLFNHATRALEVPAVIIFGSTSPVGSGYQQNINLWSNYECSPCYREDNVIAVHKKPPCPYEHSCMINYMTVERVATAIMEKLNIKHGKSRENKALPTAR